MKFPKSQIVRDKAYLKHVRSLPCVITGRMGEDIDPSHIRHGLGGGMGLKPSDDLTLPLAHELHAASHSGEGEVDFWLSNTGSFLLMRALKALARENYREYLEGK